MYSGRTFKDLKSWNPLINQTFWERNPRNEKEIRTYYMKWNPFSGTVQPMISNWIVQEPLPEWKPFHPKYLSAVNTMQHQRTEF